jgi:hypothetical protein
LVSLAHRFTHCLARHALFRVRPALNVAHNTVSLPARYHRVNLVNAPNATLVEIMAGCVAVVHTAGRVLMQNDRAALYNIHVVVCNAISLAFAQLLPRLNATAFVTASPPLVTV